MTSAFLHREVRDGVARLTLDHPPLNILTQAVLAELRTHLAELAADPTVRVLLLDAAGRHFSAGADVAEHLPPTCETMIPEFIATLRAVHEFPAPVLAAVHGRCLGGGCELAIAADLIVAADSATFGQPEIVLGVLPPAACALLPGRAPAALLAELVLTGDPMTAERWMQAGLVTRVVAADALATEARAVADRLARHSAAAVRAGKRMLRATSAPPAWQRAAEMYLNDLMQTHDAEEGLRAFLEKREPSWTHR